MLIFVSSQDLVLLGGRDVRPRLRLHRHQQERDARVPRLPLPQEENGKKEIGHAAPQSRSEFSSNEYE